MEAVFNFTNLKSLIVFFHLAGLALGLGGAWVLDAFMLKSKNQVITEEKYQLIEFVSKLVLVGLLLLWASGIAFIVYYYYLEPAFLMNQKVWGKAFIVTVLSANGFFVHRIILPKIKQKIGLVPMASFTPHEMALFTAVGAISFISWVFPVVLGVTKTLNFTVSAFDIVGFYVGFLLSSVLVSSLISTRLSRVSLT